MQYLINFVFDTVQFHFNFHFIWTKRDSFCAFTISISADNDSMHRFPERICVVTEALGRDSQTIGTQQRSLLSSYEFSLKKTKKKIIANAMRERMCADVRFYRYDKTANEAAQRHNSEALSGSRKRIAKCDHWLLWTRMCDTVAWNSWCASWLRCSSLSIRIRRQTHTNDTAASVVEFPSVG